MIENKTSFPKKTRTVNAQEEWGLDYPVQFEVWDDPSRATISDLMNIVLFTSDKELSDLQIEEQRKRAKTYFAAVSQCFVDCSIVGADFSTPQTTEETFEMPDVAWGFWYDSVAAYLLDLINTSTRLKKIRDAVGSLSSSGIDSDNTERKSNNQS